MVRWGSRKSGVKGGQFKRLLVLCGDVLKAVVLDLGGGNIGRYEGDRRGGIKSTR